jgi:hypothetical protein
LRPFASRSAYREVAVASLPQFPKPVQEIQNGLSPEAEFRALTFFFQLPKVVGDALINGKLKRDRRDDFVFSEW